MLSARVKFATAVPASCSAGRRVGQQHAAVKLQPSRGRRPSTCVAFMTERQGASQQIQVGDSLPLDATMYHYDPSTDDQKAMKLKDVAAGKKVVIFGLPGAFTSVCSSKHLPQYSEKLQDLHKAGVDTVICTSINDAWVMKEWAKALNVDPHEIVMLADGDGSFHRQLGLVQDLPGCGQRPLRYSLYAEDGKVKVINVDEAGPKSYKVSGPEHLLQDLKNLASA